MSTAYCPIHNCDFFVQGGCPACKETFTKPCSRPAPHQGPCNGLPRPYGVAYCFSEPVPEGANRWKCGICGTVRSDFRQDCPGCVRPTAVDMRIEMSQGPHGDEEPSGLDKMKAPLRPRTAAERKAEPLHSGPMTYFPDALAAVSRLCLKANDKHNPGEPMHWARGKSTDQLDCAARHILTPGEPDEFGEIELVAAAWRALAALQLAEEARLVAAGIKPYSGVVPARLGDPENPVDHGVNGQAHRLRGDQAAVAGVVGDVVPVVPVDEERAAAVHVGPPPRRKHHDRGAEMAVMRFQRPDVVVAGREGANTDIALERGIVVGGAVAAPGTTIEGLG